MPKAGRQRTGANRRGRPSVGAGDSTGVLTVDRGSEIHLARKPEDGRRTKWLLGKARADRGVADRRETVCTAGNSAENAARIAIAPLAEPSQLCRRKAGNSAAARIDPRPTWRPMPCRSASRALEDVRDGLGADAAPPIRPLHPWRGGVAQFTIPAERKGPRSEGSRPFAQRFARSLAPEADLGRPARIRSGPAHGRRT
jgi:hypothetical protein